MKLKVKVTQEHINKGKPGYDNACALALAIQDAWPEVKASVLPGLNVYFYKKGTDRASFRSDMPPEATRFADLFDANKLFVGPADFEFEVELIKGYVTTGGIYGKEKVSV